MTTPDRERSMWEPADTAALVGAGDAGDHHFIPSLEDPAIEPKKPLGKLNPDEAAFFAVK